MITRKPTPLEILVHQATHNTTCGLEPVPNPSYIRMIKMSFKYCQSEIEDRPRCNEQCDHCKAYYAPLETPFNKHDWDHLHDVVLEAVGKNMNREELRELYMRLPQNLKDDAVHWGLSDTVVRDNIYTHLTKNK